MNIHSPKVTLFPNNANVTVSIESEHTNQLKYRLTNIKGKVVLSGTTGQKVLRLDIRKFSRGMYLLYLEGRAFKRVVKFQNVCVTK